MPLFCPLECGVISRDWSQLTTTPQIKLQEKLKGY